VTMDKGENKRDTAEYKSSQAEQPLKWRSRVV
jgi:hypothetical protein